MSVSWNAALMSRQRHELFVRTMQRLVLISCWWERRRLTDIIITVLNGGTPSVLWVHLPTCRHVINNCFLAQYRYTGGPCDETTCTDRRRSTLQGGPKIGTDFYLRTPIAFYSEYICWFKIHQIYQSDATWVKLITPILLSTTAKES